MSAEPRTVDRHRRGADTTAAPRPAWRSRAWRIVGALSITETVSWGIVYYAFAVFLVPMQRELGQSTAALTGAFSMALVISAVAGIAVGRYLDAHGPRGLMTAGSIAATVLVVVWAQVEGLLALYAVWAGLGLAMATILYEPAFVVLAKWFPEEVERRRALTALTLVAALASFIFLPLAQALVDAHGWRHALIILAAVLGVTTIPLHALVLRRAPRPSHSASREGRRDAAARAVLRSGSFWLLAGAFFLASLTGLATTILAIPYLLERGYEPGFAAFAVGLVGASQIPGRLLFAPLGARLPRALALTTVFCLVGAGIAVLAAARDNVTVIAGLVLLGMGNGMTTLARASVIADRYGSRAYGAINGVAASVTTGARAVGPAAAAAYAAITGYATLLWTLVALTLIAAVLAHRSEHGLQSVGPRR